MLVRLKESKVQSLKFKVEFRDFGHWTLDFGLFSAGFSVKEKDEASLPDGFGRIRWMPSFSVLPGSEGVFVFAGGVAL